VLVTPHCIGSFAALRDALVRCLEKEADVRATFFWCAVGLADHKMLLPVGSLEPTLDLNDDAVGQHKVRRIGSLLGWLNEADLVRLERKSDAKVFQPKRHFPFKTRPKSGGHSVSVIRFGGNKFISRVSYSDLNEPVIDDIEVGSTAAATNCPDNLNSVEPQGQTYTDYG